MSDNSEAVAGCLGILLYFAVWFTGLYIVVRFVKWVWFG